MKKNLPKQKHDYNYSILDNICQEVIDKCDRAFNARMAYERNCIAKYDYPDWMCKPSKPPVKGERIEDFAYKYGTTVKEMIACLPAVEIALKLNKSQND